MPPLYLDANATTPLAPEVLDAMRPFLAGFAGNASSRHAAGRRARQALDAARRVIAEALDGDAERLVFVSGATEANALALRSLCPPGSRLWMNPTEHPSVLDAARELATTVAVAPLAVDAEGFVLPKAPTNQAATAAAVQWANSETGCVQNLPALAAAWPGVAIHADAVQAPGRIPMSFRRSGAATMAICGHKIHGPPGVGALLYRADVRLRPWLGGGHQQGGLRSGTEPVALIVGLAAALEMAVRNMPVAAEKLNDLRAAFVAALRAELPDLLDNSPANPARRLPNTANLSFLGAPAAALLMALDLAGVCCSAGSACASGSALPSHVLVAMGLPVERIASAVRFSFHCDQSLDEARAAAAIVARCVAQVRRSFALDHGAATDV